MAHTLFPSSCVSIDDIRVDSYFPEELKINGASLILALLMVCYQNNPYGFDYMAIRKSVFGVFEEPLCYKSKGKLVLKEICQDIQERFGGSFGSIYIQMKDKENGQKVGVSFWNDKTMDRSFSVAYHTEMGSASKLHRFTNQVYMTFLIQQERLLQKLEMPETEVDAGGQIKGQMEEGE